MIISAYWAMKFLTKIRFFSRAWLYNFKGQFPINAIRIIIVSGRYIADVETKLTLLLCTFLSALASSSKAPSLKAHLEKLGKELSKKTERC